MASLHGVIRAIQPLSIRDTRIPTTVRSFMPTRIFTTHSGGL